MAHVIDMLFSEWLYRDLRDSRLEGHRLRAAVDLLEKKGWSPTEVDEMRAALGWKRLEALPIFSIRPVTPLPGTIFSGLTDPSLRREFVAAGRERAQEVLDRLGWR